jgi:hypothetical protein
MLCLRDPRWTTVARNAAPATSRHIDDLRMVLVFTSRLLKKRFGGLVHAEFH